MKILKTAANSKFRVYKMQQQLLIAAGTHMCNTLTRQNPSFTNTCKQETTALTKSSSMLTVGIDLAQEREGCAAVMAGPALVHCKRDKN